MKSLFLNAVAENMRFKRYTEVKSFISYLANTKKLN